MRNLDWLYRNNSMFRETVNQAAAQWMGSDSPAFAGEWLLREHYEDLRGQHLDGPCVVPDSRFATLKEHCADQAEQLRRLTDENAELRKLAEKYRAGSIAAQEEAEAWRAKCGELLDAAHEMVRIGGDVA